MAKLLMMHVCAAQQPNTAALENADAAQVIISAHEQLSCKPVFLDQDRLILTSLSCHHQESGMTTPAVTMLLLRQRQTFCCQHI